MKKISLSIIMAALTFSAGLTCTLQYRASVARYQYDLLKARENRLRSELFQMRKLIEQHVADKGYTPASLNDLVESGYISEIPIDPVTGQRNWKEEKQYICGLFVIFCGLIDVHSASIAISSEGVRYDEW